MEKKEIKKYGSLALLAFLVCIAVKYSASLGKILLLMLGALKPMILGCVIAYIFNIILVSFEKRYFPKIKNGFINYSRRPVCLVLSFLIAIGIIILVLHIIIPELINAVSLLIEKIPPLLNQGREFILAKLEQYPEFQKQATELLSEFDYKHFDWAELTQKVTGVLKSGIVGILSSAVGFLGALSGTVTNIVIAMIFAIYLLARKDKLITDIGRIQRSFLSETVMKRFNDFFVTANGSFHSFFVGQFVEAIILGSLCFIGMSILRLPYAGMSGTLVGVTALIPIVGAFIGAGVSAFIIFTENPMQALIFIIFLVILQQVEGNIIYPKVVGDSIGLPGIWVLAAVTVGGGLFGISGMLIGVPLAATLYKMCFKTLERRERKMGIAEAPESKPVRQPKTAVLTETTKQQPLPETAPIQPKKPETTANPQSQRKNPRRKKKKK